MRVPTRGMAGGGRNAHEGGRCRRHHARRASPCRRSAGATYRFTSVAETRIQQVLIALQLPPEAG
eukprot:6178586-Pleurochrysis_carterae.AAC.5